MDFYYHPIFGLQYTCLGSVIIIDIAMIPKISIEEFLEKWKKYNDIGIIISSEPVQPVQNYVVITTNAKLD